MIDCKYGHCYYEARWDGYCYFHRKVQAGLIDGYYNVLTSPKEALGGQDKFVQAKYDWVKLGPR